MKITILFIGAQSINILLQREWFNQFGNKSNSAECLIWFEWNSTWYKRVICQDSSSLKLESLQIPLLFRVLFQSEIPQSKKEYSGFRRPTLACWFFSSSMGFHPNWLNHSVRRRIFILNYKMTQLKYTNKLGSLTHIDNRHIPNMKGI